MGFGGSGSMNVDLKNNRKFLRNVSREKFKRTFGAYRSKGKQEYDFPKAQPHTLRRIKERLVYENEQLLRRRIIAFIVICIVLITGLLYIL